MIPQNSVAIVANGDIHDHAATAAIIKNHMKVIAVDGGLQHCSRMEVTPDLIVGDFDSAAPELVKRYSKVPVKKLLREKDETDLELAIQEADKPDIDRITLIGALGFRSDHSLYNINLLGRYPTYVFIETEWETLFAIEKSFHLHCMEGQTVSLMPLGAVATGVITRGLQWELHNVTIDSRFVSLSNKCLESTVQITVTSGNLLCILQKDKQQR